MTLKNTVLRSTVALGVILLVAGLVYINHQQLQDRPDPSFQLLDGNRVSLEDFYGKPVIVLFWATSCDICVAELPHLIEFYNETGKRSFELIAVAMPYDPPNRVLEMVERMKIPFPVAIDIESRVVEAFDGISATPTMIIISPEGRIIFQQSGRVDLDKIRNMISGFLSTDINAVI